MSMESALSRVYSNNIKNSTGRSDILIQLPVTSIFLTILPSDHFVPLRILPKHPALRAVSQDVQNIASGKCTSVSMAPINSQSFCDVHPTHLTRDTIHITA